MRILIAGLGSIGCRHLRNLLALGETDIILYRTRRGALPDDELADFPTETDLTAALKRHPDAVIVANPTALHLEVAIPAARMGCHLFLEKPLSHSLAGVDKLQAAVAEGGGQVFTAFQFRFHPGLRLVKELLAGAAIGRPLSLHAHWGEYLPGWHPWEDYRQGYSARADLGGGVILTLCHPLDYLRWLFGPVEALWAFSGRQGDLALEVEDSAEIGLRYQSGITGSVHLDYNQRPSAHWVEVVGTHGCLRWDNADGAVRLCAYPDGSPPANDADWQLFPAPTGFERNHLFLAEMRHFLDVAHRSAPSLCTLEDGIQTLRLALAALKSAETGQLQRLT